MRVPLVFLNRLRKCVRSSYSHNTPDWDRFRFSNRVNQLAEKSSSLFFWPAFELSSAGSEIFHVERLSQTLVTASFAPRSITNMPVRFFGNQACKTERVSVWVLRVSGLVNKRLIPREARLVGLVWRGDRHGPFSRVPSAK